MPYIDSETKKILDEFPRRANKAGELTYLFYRRALDINPLDLEPALDEVVCGYLPRTPRYEDFAIVLGSLYGAALELKRRYGGRGVRELSAPLAICSYAANFYANTVAPYEDKKIEENGDIQ